MKKNENLTIIKRLNACSLICNHHIYLKTRVHKKKEFYGYSLIYHVYKKPVDYNI